MTPRGASVLITRAENLRDAQGGQEDGRSARFLLFAAPSARIEALERTPRVCRRQREHDGGKEGGAKAYNERGSEVDAFQSSRAFAGAVRAVGSSGTSSRLGRREQRAAMGRAATVGVHGTRGRARGGVDGARGVLCREDHGGG